MRKSPKLENWNETFFGDVQIFYFARYARKISLTPFLVIFALCVAQEKHSRESLANWQIESRADAIRIIIIV